MRVLALSTALVSLIGVVPSAMSQVAQDAEEAQQFLIPLLQSGTISFQIGNDLSQREIFGLSASVPGVATSYTKKFFGGWSEYSTFRKPARAIFNFVNFGRINEGKYDNCSTSLENVEVTAAKTADFELRFATDGLSKEEPNGDDSKWRYVLEDDPRARFGGPYRIDWRTASFERSKQIRYGWTDFLIKTDQRVPYAQFSVQGEDLADYVENAIRVLQLSCRS